MAIELVAVGTQVAVDASPVNMSLPAYERGDLLICTLTTREDNPTPVHGLTSGGVSWTQIDTTQFLDLGTTGIAQSVWYRFAGHAGGEATPAATCPTPNGLVGTIVSYRGVHRVTPLDVAALGGTAAAADTLQPNGATGITTVTAGAVPVAVVSTADDNALAYATLNGFSDVFSGASYDTTTGGDCSQAMAAHFFVSSPQTITGPTFDQTVLGTDAWAWHLFALRPDPARRWVEQILDHGNRMNATRY